MIWNPTQAPQTIKIWTPFLPQSQRVKFIVLLNLSWLFEWMTTGLFVWPLSANCPGIVLYCWFLCKFLCYLIAFLIAFQWKCENLLDKKTAKIHPNKHIPELILHIKRKHPSRMCTAHLCDDIITINMRYLWSILFYSLGLLQNRYWMMDSFGG